jgi:hypothetical protein
VLIEQVAALETSQAVQDSSRRAEIDSLSGVIETLKDSMFARSGGAEEELHLEFKQFRLEFAQLYGAEISMLEDSIRDIKDEQAALFLLIERQGLSLQTLRDSLACAPDTFHVFTVDSTYFRFGWEPVVDLDNAGNPTDGVNYEVTMAAVVVAVDAAGNRSKPSPWDGTTY